jgi:hypothetical protein
MSTAYSIYGISVEYGKVLINGVPKSYGFERIETQYTKCKHYISIGFVITGKTPKEMSPTLEQSHFHPMLGCTKQF